jgi:Uma2 family endonuclease
MGVREAVPVQPKSEQLYMSHEAFLEWAGDRHAEWVDGAVIVFMPAREYHQNALGFLHFLLLLFARLFGVGRVLVAPFEMKLRHGRSYREPDILFIAQENLERLSEERLDGPADLVVEIVSDDSVRRDREDKFKEYEAAGIREYWIVDPRPDKQRADFFWLNENGRYELFATEEDERVESRLLAGFWLRPDWLWQAGELDPLTAFAEMAGLPETLMTQFRRQAREGLKKAEGRGQKAEG